ncbi:MAG: DNA polymerase III subunit gamma/tau, partial [Caldimonas sp.]
LLDQAVYKPVLGRFKVYLIDEVHMLSSHAFNAMLKTLEEPPDYLKFILATTDPQKVPATVLSRCLQFNLRPMAPQTIVEHLGTVLAAEKVIADLPALKLIARAARGSMRDAESLADQAIAYGDGRIEAEAVRQMLGAVDRSHAVRIIEASAAQDGAALVGAVDALRDLGLSAAGALEEIAAMLQKMAVLQAVPESAEAGDPEGEVAIRLAALLPPDETQMLYSIVLHGRAELVLAPDEYSGLVMVLLRMLAFPPRDAKPIVPMTVPTPVPMAAPATQFSETSADAATATARSEPARDAMPISAAAPAAAAAEISGTAAADRWIALVLSLVGAGAVTAMVRELAMQAECVGIVESGQQRIWRLRVERENLRAPALRDRLQAAVAVAEAFAVGLEIEAGAAADSAALRDVAERARRQTEAERVIHEDPLVKALMAQYKTARIVPGSVKPLIHHPGATT